MRTPTQECPQTQRRNAGTHFDKGLWMIPAPEHGAREDRTLIEMGALTIPHIIAAAPITNQAVKALAAIHIDLSMPISIR